MCVCAKSVAWMPKVTDPGKGEGVVDYPTLTCKSFLVIVQVFPVVSSKRGSILWNVQKQKEVQNLDIIL